MVTVSGVAAARIGDGGRRFSVGSSDLEIALNKSGFQRGRPTPDGATDAHVSCCYARDGTSLRVARQWVMNLLSGQIQVGQDGAHALDERSWPEHRHVRVSRLEIVPVEGHEPLAALADGGTQDREIPGVGDGSVGREIPPRWVRDHAKRPLYQEAKGGQGLRELRAEVSFSLGDRLLRRDSVNQCDLAHAQRDQAGAVLAG